MGMSVSETDFIRKGKFLVGVCSVCYGRDVYKTFIQNVYNQDLKKFSSHSGTFKQRAKS